jgi:DNA-binding MarR family transcriptional regulator
MPAREVSRQEESVTSPMLRRTTESRGADLRPPRPTGGGAAADRGAPDALLDALRAVSRELRMAEREAEQRIGLPPAQVHVVRQLGERPAASLAELAERTHTDPSSASIVVQRLVERGLVARTPAADDRRRIELTLTPGGRALLRRVPASSDDRLAEAVAALGSTRAAALTRSLEHFARALRESADDAAP